MVFICISYHFVVLRIQLIFYKLDATNNSLLVFNIHYYFQIEYTYRRRYDILAAFNLIRKNPFSSNKLEEYGNI